MPNLAQSLIRENKDIFYKNENATFLDIGNCGLTEIPEELFDCFWIEELVLSNQYVDFISGASRHSKNDGKKNTLYSIPSQIGSLRNLKTLHIGGSYGNSWGIFDLRNLSSLASLVAIDLSYNKIEHIDIIHLLTGIKYLNLSNNEIEDV